MIPMTDSFEEADNEKVTTVTYMKEIYEITLYIFKIVLILISFFIVLFLIYVANLSEEGIVIQPFESNEKDLSSVSIAHHLGFELQDIKETNEKKLKNSEKRSISGNIPPILLQDNSLDYHLADIGNVGIEGSSLSLGQLIKSLRYFNRRSAPMLTGSIQSSESELRIIAVYNYPNSSEGILAWEITKDISNNTTEDIYMMMEDLAFQIVTTLNNKKTNSKDFPQSWEALKHLTMSRKAYIEYNITHNISYLNKSRDLALMAKESEPFYSKMSNLFSNIGFSYLKINKYTDAEQIFKVATELAPSDAEAWAGLGSAYLFQNNNSSSIHAFNYSVRFDPRNVDTWYNRGLALYYNNDYNESVRSYDKAIELDSKNADAWYNRGLALYYNKDYNESIRSYDQAIKLNSTDVDSWLNKGISLLDAKRSGEAIQAFEKSPNDADAEKAWKSIGVAYYQIGNYIESDQAYDKAISINKCNKETWYQKGLSFKEAGNYNESIEAFKNATEIYPNYKDAWSKLSNVYGKLGDNNNASTALKNYTSENNSTQENPCS
jgi:tetratricopeptide (TPR) repeat protein